MRFFRISNILYLSVAVLFASLLFWTSQMVQQAEDERRHISDKLAAEQNSLHVLEAEWHYLNRPQRLEQLAYDQLKIGPGQKDTFLPDVGAVPQPPVPVLPGIKPAIFSPPMPKAPVVTQQNVSEHPDNKKINDRASFNSLVGSLTQSGGER